MANVMEATGERLDVGSSWLAIVGGNESLNQGAEGKDQRCYRTNFLLMGDKDEVGQVAAKLLSRWCLRKSNAQRKWKGRSMIKNTNLLNLRCP